MDVNRRGDFDFGPDFMQSQRDALEAWKWLAFVASN